MANNASRNFSVKKESTATSLTEIERRLQFLADNLPYGLVYQIVIDPKGQRRFSYLSAGIERIHGVTPEQVYANPQLLYNQIDKADLSHLFASEEYSLRHDTVFCEEVRFLKPNGEVGYVLLRSTPRRLDDGSTIWDGIELDISERRQTEEALQQQANEIAQLMKSMANAFVVWGTIFDENDKLVDIRFDYFNDAYSKVSGLSLSEVQGKTVREVWPATEESWYSTYGDVALSGKPKSFEMYHSPTNGLYSCCAYRPTTSRDRVCCVFENITERKLAEQERNKLQEQLQQAMKMEAVGRLAGGVAHDFNNLLTAIIGNIELVRMHINPADPIVLQLDEAAKAADSAAALTAQLLAFSRRQIIEPQILNLNELISNLQKMLVRLIGEDIKFQTILNNDIGFVKIDRGQFEQVIVNLAINARDSMPTGGTLRIETSPTVLDSDYCSSQSELKPGSYVRLTVSDTGFGMTDEVKAHIFEPFFTTKPPGRGTGLGLATIYGAVTQADGHIEVQSEVGIGTVFKIYLPTIDGPLDNFSKAPTNTSIQKGHETILLVEDDEAVRSMALKILEMLGYATLSAENGAEAIALVEQHAEHIDLLITDVIMPGINGRELAKQLVIKHPEMEILFTSGYTEDVISRNEVVEAELNFIGKPYTMKTLAQKIRDVLDKR